ncbi:hypothetical protein TH53_21845 [Pedobacter lusitanus]|uniref:Uncharacterized protein n=1 Tax=Pedobacter lusitanus TaxID=1503925 RepID=A0A0D0GLH2_9SPHI|nr:hypothetical protein [Pedobacter lusitanus]KIO75256.1 hypothetical protein TH53_21845 [Pedobacter lusitanus]
MSLESLKALTDQIRKALDESIDNTNPDEVIGKMNELASLQGTASHTMALAEMVYNQKLMELVQAAEYSKLSATDKRFVIMGKAKNEIYYVTNSERLAKSLVHRQDVLRSTLSFIKSEMENLHNQTH